MTIPVILIIVLLALFRTPLFAILGGLGLFLLYQSGIDTSALIIEMYRMTGTPVLLAIPFFTFAGYLLSESQAPKRIFRLAQLSFSGFSSGLGIATLVICAIFTALTGASGVTIIAIGGLVYPMLIRQQYSEKFALGLVTTSGSLGLLFPPSLPIILYGVFGNTNISQLYTAGLIPGILLVVVLSLYTYFQTRHLKPIATEPFQWTNLFKAIKDVGWEAPVPFMIILFILKGIIIVNEAAVITAAYLFVVEFFIKKDLSLKKDLIRIIQKSMIMVGGILIIMGMALGLTNYLIDEEIPMKMFEIVETYISSKLVFLLLLNIFLIVVGCMMDIFSAIMVVVPIILPVAQKFNIDPIHLGIIFLTNLEIGYLTPPVGLNLFLSSFRFNKSIISVYRASIPFIIVLLIALLLITYIPELSLFLINP